MICRREPDPKGDKQGCNATIKNTAPRMPASDRCDPYFFGLSPQGFAALPQRKLATPSPAVQPCPSLLVTLSCPWKSDAVGSPCTDVTLQSPKQRVKIGKQRVNLQTLPIVAETIRMNPLARNVLLQAFQGATPNNPNTTKPPCVFSAALGLYMSL